MKMMWANPSQAEFEDGAKICKQSFKFIMLSYFSLSLNFFSAFDALI